MTPPFNKQLFENSTLKSLLLDDDIAASPTQLFNSKDPNLAVLHEKPEHRLMLYMKAHGASNREIAAKCGYTEPWVSQVLRQPWARKYLLEEMRAAGVDELHTILQGAAADSLFKLIELRDDEKAPKAVQHNSAIALLDRFMGKPVQRVEQEIVQTLDVTSVERIDEQLAVVEEQERALLGTRN